MFRKRLITACVLLPWAILGTLFLSSPAFAVNSAALFLWANWEWTAFVGFKSKISRLGCLILLLLSALLLMIILSLLGKVVLEEGLFLLIVAFWVLALYALYHYPKSFLFSKSPIIRLFIGGLVLIPAWCLLVALQYQDPGLALYVLILTWCADTSAYFIGKRFGKHKLAPIISPRKTWEGAFGALMVNFLVIGLGYLALHPTMSVLSWIVLGILTVIFSIVGDLWVSAYKRICDVKDSGSLLPGHGGVLDRIDSLTAAVPIFTIGFMVFS